LAQKKETIIVKKIKDFLNTCKEVKCFKTHGTGFSEAGVHDLVGCAGGSFFSIEVKTPENKKGANKDGMTDLQVMFMNGIRMAKGVSFVATNLDQVVNELFIKGLISQEDMDRGKDYKCVKKNADQNRYQIGSMA
jgi:penicillin-binding protein-related factor A (putative recombinase)